MIEFDDSDQLNDGELESFDSQELVQKRSRNEAVEAFVGAANAAANDIIDRVARDPQVKVDRQQFLQQQFANSPCLDKILLHGPQSVYELEMLAQKAHVMVCSEAEEISAAGVSIRHYEAYSAAGGMGFGWWLVEHYLPYHINCPNSCGLGETAGGRKDPPYFQVGYGSFDNIPDLIDSLVESPLPV